MPDSTPPKPAPFAPMPVLRSPFGRRSMVEMVGRDQEPPVSAPSRRKRTKSVRAKSELWLAEDVAAIIPLSIRKIQMIAMEGGLGAFKLPNCSLWFFSETVVREKISIYINGLPQPIVTPCANRKKPKTKTTTCKTAKASGMSDTSYPVSPSAYRFLRRMPPRPGKSATKS